jgi:DNA-binding LacI/PurR family transcriptional regulator
MNSQHYVTIKDIAQKLKVSVSTVSRALRGSTEIKEETRNQVLELAEELHYSPDPIALSLKDKRTKVIGVMVQEIANNYCSATIAGIEDYANKRGYHVLISQSHEKYDVEVLNTRLLASRRIDGLIITLSNETKNVEHLKALIEKGIPVVMFDRISEQLNTHKVVVDDYHGAFEATAHLIGQGYKRVAHLTIAKYLSITQHRLQGYADALKASSIPVRRDWIIHCDFNMETVEKNIRCLFQKSDRPNAILTSVERLSVACLKVLRDMQLHVPEEVAIAGFSDNPLNGFLNPALTSVTQPTFEIGQKAAELLIEQIESKKNLEVFKTIELKTTMDIRESSSGKN